MSSSFDFKNQTLVKLSKSYKLLKDEDDELRSFVGLCQSNHPDCSNMTFVVDRFGKIRAKMERTNNVSSLINNTLEFLDTME
ncbi:MAG: alkyl hydroperoxide reductase subunit AhpC [Parvicella sp.]